MGSDEVRRWAVQIQQIGDDVRRLADRTLTADAVRWRSTAAAGFRRRLAEEAARARVIAVELDCAAEALLRHAVAVDGGARRVRPRRLAVTLGFWLRVDRAIFDRWAQALCGLPLPEEVRPPEPALAPSGSKPSGSKRSGSERSGSERSGFEERGFEEPGFERPLPVPPSVAASLAVHGCAEVAVTVRLTMPEGAAFACFGLFGEVAAGLVRSGDDVDIGLFALDELVEQVVLLVPGDPPAPIDAAPGCVRITVLGPDAAVAGWQQILVSGETHWLRMQSGAHPNRLVPVVDVHRELAADLRFVLAGCLTRAQDRRHTQVDDRRTQVDDRITEVDDRVTGADDHRTRADLRLTKSADHE